MIVTQQVKSTRKLKSPSLEPILSHLNTFHNLASYYRPIYALPGFLTKIWFACLISAHLIPHDFVSIIIFGKVYKL